MEFVYFSESATIASLNSINHLIFVMRNPCVFYEVIFKHYLNYYY